MAEVIDCPGCKRKLQVPDDVVGQRVQCPTCAVVFVAQAGTLTPTPPPVPRMADDERDELERRSSARRRLRFDDEDDDFCDDDEEDEGDSRRCRRRRGWAPHRGDTVLTIGILSLAALFMICPPASIILGPMAWIMGNGDLAEMDAGRMDPSGRSNTSVGRVLGIVTTCLVVIPTLFFCVIVGVVAMVGAAGR